MHLQVVLAGPEVPEAPKRNGDKMQQLQMNISAFTFMYFLNHKMPQYIHRRKCDTGFGKAVNYQLLLLKYHTLLTREYSCQNCGVVWLLVSAIAFDVKGTLEVTQSINI